MERECPIKLNMKFFRERGWRGILLRLQRLVDLLFCYHPVNLFAEYGMCIKSLVNRYSKNLYLLSIIEAAATVKFESTLLGSRKDFSVYKLRIFFLSTYRMNYSSSVLGNIKKCHVSNSGDFKN
jgi:hypothetical protein